MRLLGAFYELIRMIVSVVGLRLPSAEQLHTIVGRFFVYRQTRKFIRLDENFSRQYYGRHKNKFLCAGFSRRLVLPQILAIDPAELSADSDVKLVPHNEKFEPSDSVAEITEPALDRIKAHVSKHSEVIFHNSLNIRVKHIVRNVSSVEIHTQPADYNSYLRTNLCLDFNIDRRNSLRTYVHPNGLLDELGESQLANLLGINVILFTPSGQLIVQRRSFRTVVRPGELAPSISGTVIPSDIQRSNTELSQLDVLREGIEELGMYEDDLNGTPKFLGMTRELVRGGQPELFFSGTLNISDSEIRNRWSEAIDRNEADEVLFERVFGVENGSVVSSADRKLVAKSLIGLINKHKSTMSLPLKTALVLWFRLEVSRLP